MTYNPVIPLGSRTISDNGPGFRANFTQANTHFAIDHTAFTSGTNVGFHKKISFIGVNPAAVVPITTEGITVVAEYMPNVALEERERYALFYRQNSAAHADADYQLTGTQVPVNASVGSTFLPGGLMIQWGRTAVLPIGTSPAIPFQTDFDAAPYSIVITAIKAGGGSGLGIFVKNGSETKHQFKVLNEASAPHDIYWVAIGPRA